MPTPAPCWLPTRAPNTRSIVGVGMKRLRRSMLPSASCPGVFPLPATFWRYCGWKTYNSCTQRSQFPNT
eukprot:6491773-Amphidinium_carterae.2